MIFFLFFVDNGKNLFAWVSLTPATNFFSLIIQRCFQRDKRGVAPAYYIETEVNDDSKSTNEREPFLVGLLGLSSQPSTKYFFSSPLKNPTQVPPFPAAH
jgi:hypothetical protein